MLGAGLFSGRRGAGLEAVDATRPQPAVPEVPVARAPGLAMAYVVTGVAGVGFFVLSMLLLGWWPGRVIAEEVAASSPPAVLQLTESEQRGRGIYAREGCAYCHTQQVRYLPDDIRRFGAPTLAWEIQFDRPHLWGTRRVGPDLSREGGTRSLDWQYAHLFAPRALVPQSIMPSYAAFFDGSPQRPLAEARDLVAYLQSLGRARLLAGVEGEQHASEAIAHPHMSRTAFDSPVLNAHPAMARTGTDLPQLAGVVAAGNGRQLWDDNCAGCHGADARGDGPAAAWLSPAPGDLAAHRYSREYLAQVLWNGHGVISRPRTSRR
jgi:cbb3-type cytochrome oxidase cytochrome c subunit